MKKNLFCLAALCAAALVSCTPKELIIEEPESIDNPKETAELIHITIKASMSESTKATISTDRTWTWDASDKLAVFDGTTVTKEFGIKEILSDGQAIFEGDVASTASLTAVFPYAAALSDGSYKLSSEQTISTGQTVDPSAMVATATGEKASDSEFTFYFTPAVSFFRLSVGAGVSKVILHTVGKDDTIAGESRSVTVNLPGTAGSFWAAVNPAVYHGIRAFAYDGTSYAKKGADAAEIDLSAKGSGKNIGTVSGGTAVSVIENADNLISYLGNPALDGYIVNDLDLTGKTITSCASFAKTFDGQYHSIKNWTSEGTALFGANSGTVKDFTLDSSCKLNLPATLAAGDYAFVVKTNQGTVSGIRNEADVAEWTGEITGAINLGIIVGNGPANSIVENCYNSGKLVINAAEHGGIGTSAISGVCGRLTNKTSSAVACINRGNIDITTGINAAGANIYCAGVLGCTTNTVSAIECINYGKIDIQLSKTNSALIVAGVSSYTSGPLTGCENHGEISINSDTFIQAVALGGVCAYSSGAMENCMNDAKISLTAQYFNGGNAIGSIKSDTTVSTTTGALAVGGIVGYTYNKFSMDNCHNEGNIIFELSEQDQKVAIGSTYRFEFGGCVADAWGDINNSHNTGDIEAYVRTSTGDAFTPVKPSDTSSAGGGGTLYIGGIAGANYEAIGQSCLNITGCTNTGQIITHSDSQSTTNCAFGGIVGWPGKEADCTSITKQCTNGAESDAEKGSITVSGFITYRAGGIQGGSGRIEDCTNYGTIYAKSGKPSIGGIAGYHGGGYQVSSSSNYGTLKSDVKATGVGGLIGALQNIEISFGEGCKVDCNLVSSNTTEIGLILGHFNGNTYAITLGSETNPIKVKGECKGTTVSTDNYLNYLYGPAKYSSSLHTVFAEYWN
ncbi:MAG: hypothetical protein IJP55_05405 [Bacteroidales bacterium]|nr:hypothetical protein [Bacteroidales bacterium]